MFVYFPGIAQFIKNTFPTVLANNKQYRYVTYKYQAIMIINM